MGRGKERMEILREHMGLEKTHRSFRQGDLPGRALAAQARGCSCKTSQSSLSSNIWCVWCTCTLGSGLFRCVLEFHTHYYSIVVRG